MVSVFDVAAYILEKQGRMTTMRLQKLCYYAQAWSLVWDGWPLFAEPFEAWAYGPVCPELYRKHKGMFRISREELHAGDPTLLNSDQRETVNSVMDYYGSLDVYRLNELVCGEVPWKDTRGGIPMGEECRREIPLGMIGDYYSGLARRGIPDGAGVTFVSNEDMEWVRTRFGG